MGGLTPIMDAAAEYIARGNIRMHTPGHAGKAEALPAWFSDFARYDLTELPGLGSLYEPDGPIARSEELAARLFGAGQTLFSAGGNTLCIQTMLSVLPRGSRVLMPRSAVHRSAINAAALLGLEPVFVPAGGNAVDMAAAAALMEEHRPVGIYVTSPDYYGRMADIAALAVLAESYGVPLMADNAHGSHLKFVRPDLHPLTLGAHLTADSAHKTLGVLTGGAMLHARKGYVPPRPLKELMAVFGSTSPGYPVLMSIEYACAELAQNGGQRYVWLAEKVKSLRNVAARCGFGVIDGDCDPIRLAVNGRALGFTGRELFDRFAQNSLMPEWADESWCVMLPSAFASEDELDTAGGIIQKLAEDGGCALPEGDEAYAGGHIPARRVPLGQAMAAPAHRIQVSEAVGRVSARTVSLCPPGVPVLVAGEEIDVISRDALINSGIFSVEVL